MLSGSTLISRVKSTCLTMALKRLTRIPGGRLRFRPVELESPSFRTSDHAVRPSIPALYFVKALFRVNSCLTTAFGYPFFSAIFPSPWPYLSPILRSSNRSFARNEATIMRQRLCMYTIWFIWSMAASTIGRPVRPSHYSSLYSHSTLAYSHRFAVLVLRSPGGTITSP